ncbi:MAG: hypothetical protein ACPLTR_10965 [Thermacetogeniaceae bacterium]
MRRKLRISNKYDKMAPEELENVLRDFCGLDDRVLDVIWRVSLILVQHYLTERETGKVSLEEQDAFAQG